MLSHIILAFGFSTGFNPPLDIHIPTSEEIAEIVADEYSFEDHSMVEKDEEVSSKED
jgi:hypothetical protein